MIKKTCILIYSLTGMLLLLQAGFSCLRVTDGNRLSAMETETRRLTTENRRLMDEIYTLTSMDAVSRYALAARLQPVEIIRYPSALVAARR